MMRVMMMEEEEKEELWKQRLLKQHTNTFDYIEWIKLPKCKCSTAFHKHGPQDSVSSYAHLEVHSDPTQADVFLSQPPSPAHTLKIPTHLDKDPAELCIFTI